MHVPAKPMNFVLAFMFVPPKLAHHDANLIEKGLRQIKTTHCKLWD
jgi:hypothetical protein